MSVAHYLHTIRYLKPVQIFGRIRFFLHVPSIHNDLGLPLRKRADNWVPSLSNPRSLCQSDRFRFLNEEHDLLCPADWNAPAREKLWLYHLHYFDDLNAEGAEEREAWHRSLMDRWVTENPPGWGNGWESYPLSRRIVNWIQWHCGENKPQSEILKSLANQARQLRKRLEWHLLGNHLVANAKALVFAGLFFDGGEAEGWLTKGASIFAGQLREQILADGGHFERSPMYHAQVLKDVLDVMNVMQAYPEVSFAGRRALEEGCGDAARGMLVWMAMMSHPDGEIALLNDSAFGDAPRPAALAAYAGRLGLGPGGRLTSVASGGSFQIQSLRDTGYIRVDSGDMVAFLDTAPIGPDYLPGHAHADTLAFELSLGRQRVIVDSGVSRYGDGPERLRQRGTAAHNTVSIDGQDSSEVWGGFRVARRAYPHDLKIRESEGVVSCAHDGYRRLPGKPVHRREWRFREGGMKLRDEISGSFRAAIGRLHFHPEIRLEPASGACGSGRIILPDGRAIHWQIEKGCGRLCDTTWHPEFGLSIPNRCLEIAFTERDTIVDLAWDSPPDCKRV